jgi:hypothetical protein
LSAPSKIPGSRPRQQVIVLVARPIRKPATDQRRRGHRPTRRVRRIAAGDLCDNADLQPPCRTRRRSRYSRLRTNT